MKKIAFSFSGGGIRGIIPAYICNYLEQQLGHSLPIDFIGGTSTGSILGGAIAAGISSEDILDFYLKDGPYVFGKNKISYRIKSVGGLFGGKYDSTKLDERLALRLGDIRLEELNTPFLCTAYNMTKGEPVIFSSIKDKDILLRDVIVASSSAPTYFNPKIINGNAYIDGGVFCSNPSIATFTEAKKHYKIMAEDLYLVSIGTGDRSEGHWKVDRWFKYKWIKPLIDLMMSSDGTFTDDMMYNLYNSVNKPNNFFEINYKLPEILRGDMADASYSNMSNLVNFASEYTKTHKKYLDFLVKRIRNLEI